VKAVVVTAPGTIAVETLDDPAPGPHDVVVAVAACGICGTDLHILDGEHGRLPIVPGHEFAGEVVAIGREVTTVRVGDRVAADPNLPCLRCYECRRGRLNLCEHLDAVGVTVPGAAAELVVAPAANCVVLPEGVEVADAALIEPLSCAVRAFDVLRAQLAASVLIYGAGTMGLMNLQLAKHAGAASVAVVDPNESRLEAARALGCSAAARSADDLASERGWDVVIDCTGVVAAIEDGLARVARAGTFLQFGVTSPDAHARVMPYRVYRDELTITGSMAVLYSFERAAALFVDGVVDPAVFISDRLPLDDYAQAIERFRAGQGRKIVVTPAA
jgi:2-desacetyl-2-hydroxyethyl bacteriochlorophyllide A dehydrogenase